MPIGEQEVYSAGVKACDVPGWAYRNVLSSLAEQCEQLIALLNGLLLVSADAEKSSSRREPVDLAALAFEAGEMFAPLAEEKGVQLVTDICVPVTVAGDRSRLGQLVTNLLDNAIRFTDSGGTVTLQVDGVADRAILRVSDTGFGIPAVHLPHIFERFYQEDAARSAGGFGLGLSICRWIVKAHGGTIEARNGEVKGAEFRVVLPLRSVATSQPETASTIASGEVLG